MRKPIIIHFIYDLGLGGAEKMLVNSIQKLNTYDHVLVTLHSKNDFVSTPFKSMFNLNCLSIVSIPMAIVKLKKIIRKIQPILVHSHLPLPNIIARFSTPDKIPLFTSIHTTPSKSLSYGKYHIRLLEKISYLYRPSTIIAVSRNVLNDYFYYFNIRPKNSHVLHTYAFENNLQKGSKKKRCAGRLRIVTIGAKESKNIKFLLESIVKCKNQSIELDIYGGGPVPEIYTTIQKLNLPVYFRGVSRDIYKSFNNYDIYISASKFEGFSLAVLEAMASKLTLILSDIPSHKEQAGNTAMYFEIVNHDSLCTILNTCLDEPQRSSELAELSYNRFLQNFTFTEYISKLKYIYQLQK